LNKIRRWKLIAIALASLTLYGCNSSADIGPTKVEEKQQTQQKQTDTSSQKEENKQPELRMDIEPSKAQAKVNFQVEHFTLAEDPPNSHEEPGDDHEGKQEGGHIHVVLDGERTFTVAASEVNIYNLSLGQHTLTATLVDEKHEPTDAEITETFEITEGITLDVKVQPTNEGAVLTFLTSHFELASDSIGKEPKQGEGHLHLEIDGGKYVPVADQTYTITKLAAGEHEVKISLQDNNHQPIGIEKTVYFEVKEQEMSQTSEKEGSANQEDTVEPSPREAVEDKPTVTESKNALRDEPSVEPSKNAAKEAEKEEKVIVLEARNWEWIVNQPTIEAGETVKIVATSTEGHHELTIRGTDIKVELPEGEEVVVYFTPEEAGEYKIVCTHFCGEGHYDMRNTITVK
jgi:plastocyanin